MKIDVASGEKTHDVKALHEGLRSIFPMESPCFPRRNSKSQSKSGNKYNYFPYEKSNIRIFQITHVF
jgi:hypothetical protein